MTSTADVAEAVTNCLRTISAWQLGTANLLGPSIPTGSVGQLRPSDCHLDAIEKVLSDVKDSEEKMRQMIPTIAAARNSQLPISRLPPELLRYVFEYHFEGTIDSQQLGDTYPTCIIASVCSYWRAVALGSPMLWSRIDLSRPLALVDCLMERAAGHPLTVDCDHSSGRKISVTAFYPHFFKAHIQSIKDLTLATDFLFPDTFRECLTLHAPILQRCTVRVTSLPSGIRPVLSEPLFGNCAPQLRYVDIRGLDFSWVTVPLTANLSTLILHCSIIPEHAGAIIHQILEGSPNLQVLELRADGRQIIDLEAMILLPRPSAPMPRLRLKLLQTLILDIPSSLLQHVLSFVDAPFLRKIELTLSDIGGAHIEDVRRLCSRDVLPPLPLLNTVQLVVVVLNRNSARRLAQFSVHGIGEELGDGLAGRNFMLEWRPYRNDLTQETPDLRSMLDSLCRLTGQSLRALVCVTDFDAPDHPCEIPLGLLSLPRLGFEGAAAAMWMARNTSKTAPADAAAQWTELEEIFLANGVVEADAMLDFVDWCNSCFENPQHKLRSLSMLEMTVKVDSDEIADKVLDRVRSMREHDITLNCTDINFWYPD
ncbi:hypothetical protein PsYK624_024880 [Phanerochaete sordida]|uniref:F-box domain-containing protein n=1 Tax=Phanerochaete sordida TaxID=48140 RepID=A0A9P3G1A5_9APHY|nr:hypothetical protein PsYK624_024880 [Phanerochaete sordida]